MDTQHIQNVGGKAILLLPFLICLLCLSTTSSYAGVENRPLNTDDAYTLDEGTITAAIGVVFTRAANRDKETDFNMDLGYGITSRLEITADIPLVFSDPRDGNNEQGIGDIAIRPEFLLTQDKGYIPATSFAITIKTPSGDKDRSLGTGETDYSLALQFSNGLEAAQYHFNIGYTFVGEPKGEATEDVILYNLAFDYMPYPGLLLVGELTGNTNSDPNASDTPLEGLVGFIVEISNSLALDFGIGGGFNNASPDLRVTNGLTYQF